jgi:hypothetical protein
MKPPLKQLFPAENSSLRVTFSKNVWDAARWVRSTSRAIKTSKREVAVKTVRPDILNDEDLRKVKQSLGSNVKLAPLHPFDIQMSLT